MIPVSRNGESSRSSSVWRARVSRLVYIRNRQLTSFWILDSLGCAQVVEATSSTQNRNKSLSVNSSAVKSLKVCPPHRK